jgi:hypothetical protein
MQYSARRLLTCADSVSTHLYTGKRLTVVDGHRRLLTDLLRTPARLCPPRGQVGPGGQSSRHRRVALVHPGGYLESIDPFRWPRIVNIELFVGVMPVI